MVIVTKLFVCCHSMCETQEHIFTAIAVPLLLHPLGWFKFGIHLSVIPSQSDADVVVELVPSSHMPRAFQKLSACDMKTKHIFINESRWLRKEPDESQLHLVAYRAYVLQHELGHALGLHHVVCKAGGGNLVPVMMQQTLGIGDCIPQPFPTLFDIEQQHSQIVNESSS